VPRARPAGLGPEVATYVAIPVGEVPAGLVPSGVPAGKNAGLPSSAIGVPPGRDPEKVEEPAKSTLLTR